MRLKKYTKFGFIISLVIATLFSCTIFSASAGETVGFNVGSATVGNNTQKAEITISVTNNDGYAAADITIVSGLEIESIEDLGVNAVSNIENGKVNWSRAQNSYTTGDILKVTFLIPASANEGDCWDIDLLVTEIINEDILPVSYSVVKGKICIGNSEAIYNNYNDQLIINYKQKKIQFIAYSSGTDECVDVTWTSSNEKVATIDEGGLVTAKTVGTTLITSTDENNATASTELTVKYSFLQWLIIIFLFGWIWY